MCFFNQKKGRGHIEVIISFVFFFGFLIFALYFFNPVNPNRVLDSSLYYAQDEIIKNLSVKVETYSFIISSGAEGVYSVDFTELSGKVRVEKENGESLLSSSSNNKVIFQNPTDNKIAKILISEEFQESSFSGTPTLTGVLGSNNILTPISEKRAKSLASVYSSSYSELKKEFNLPNRVDFSFSIKSDEFEVLAEREIQEGLEVFSKSKRIEVLTEDGKIVFADLIVKVW